MGEQALTAAAAAPLPPVQSRTIGGEGFSLMPRNFEEFREYVKIIANSDLAPPAYRGKPENVMVAIQMGNEVGLHPLQSVQNIAVINARPSIYGDVGKAILRSKGCDIEEADIDEIEKTGIAWCIITRPGQKPVKRTFSKANAVTANLWGKSGPWTNYPYRQQAWRAFWFAARDAASDLLKGLAGREEMQDIVEVSPDDYTITAADVKPQRKSEQGKAVAETKVEKSEPIEPKVETIQAESGTTVTEGETPPEKTGNPTLDYDPNFADPQPADAGEDKRATEAEINDLFDAMRIKKIKANTLLPEMKTRYGKASPSDLTRGETRELTKWVRELKP